MEKGTAVITYIRMKVPIIYKKDESWGHKGLLIMTPKWSSNFLDRLDKKQVALQRVYLGHKGNIKILIKIF